MRVVVVGALYGVFGVGLGALGAHQFDASFTPPDSAVFQTAVLYQLFHAVLMVALGALKDQVLPNLLGAASWCFGLGVALFSGSLYLLSLGGIEAAGYATPVGGLLLLVGWLIVAVAAARRL